MFKRLAVVATALVAMASGASAADIAVKAPRNAVVAPVAYLNWTGFYVGGSLGYAWGETDEILTIGPLPADEVFRSIESTGVVGSVFVGYDYQFANNVVVGFRIGSPFGDVDGSVSDPAFPGIQYSSELKWAVLATGNIGYAMGPWLPYVGGGVAIARGEGCISGSLFPACDSQTHTGYTLLAGLRYMLNQNWATGVQYNYTDLGSQTYAFPGAVTREIGFHSNSVSALLTYRF